MRWLWLISVGVTDVQFPVWTQDDYGCWQGPQRFQLGRSGVRQTHLGLLNLLRQGRIHFDAELPPLVARNISDGLHLEFEQDAVSGEFLAALHPSGYRLSEHADIVPNDHEDSLPLYCPKVAPLAEKAMDMFGTGSVAVLVLNTRRAESFGAEARDEPIASGPLVSRDLAERLGLSWLDNAGALSQAFGAG